MSLGFIARRYGLAGYVLAYHWQLFLHCWHIYFATCLLGVVWGVVAGSE